MTFWRLYYHIVWGTKNREPLITPTYEELIQRSIRLNCQQFSVLVHAIGVMPDHVHLVVSIPPSVSLANFMHRIKGSSSHLLRESGSFRAFYWQPEYGAISLHEDLLPKIVDYVLNQRQRHAHDQLRPALEITSRPYNHPQGTP
jgi:putative transposase